MPRYNYESVKKIIYEKSNGKCELLSNEYVNDKTPLLLKCQCGKTFERTFAKLKNSQFICKDCIHKNYSKNYSLSFENVLQIIKDGNCEYINGEYINLSSKLKLKCSCGNEFYKSIAHFKGGQNHCPQCGKENSRKSKLKYDLNIAKKILSNKGYTMLDENYKDCVTPIKCMCKRGHIVEIKLMNFLSNKSGCKICANIDSRGENHWNYKGGESEVLDFFRKSLKEWKANILKRDNYKCVITSNHQNLEVHHLKSFMQIVQESCEELNIPLHRKMKDYNQKDFEKLYNLIMQKHTLDIGVTLNKDIHKEFHNIYGKNNNTLKQFEEFKTKF